MGIPTSEVGYTPAMSRREDHEVHKDMWWHWTKKKKLCSKFKIRGFHKFVFKLWLHFPLLHHVVIKRNNVLQAGTGSIFRMKEMVLADPAAVWWKKMCLLYRRV